jgi:hypothetical protein
MPEPEEAEEDYPTAPVEPAGELPAQPEPTFQRAEPAMAQPPELTPDIAASGGILTRVLSDRPNEVVLSMFLEVISVQLTPELRMGAIRARPSSGEVSLHVVSRGTQVPQTGFKLGEVGLDGKGRIATMRLIPSSVPVRVAPTQNSLQIAAVSVVPIDSTTRMQLTPTPGAPMTLRLLADLELAGVELSSTFQISHIVLKDRGRPIRVTMSAQTPGQEENGTICEAVAVRLDHAARITELLLCPVR